MEKHGDNRVRKPLEKKARKRVWKQGGEKRMRKKRVGKHVGKTGQGNRVRKLGGETG